MAAGIMMDAVKRMANRQELHEKIREYSMIAGEQVKVWKQRNNLVELIVRFCIWHDTRRSQKLWRSRLVVPGADRFLAEQIHQFSMQTKISSA